MLGPPGHSSPSWLLCTNNTLSSSKRSLCPLGVGFPQRKVVGQGPDAPWTPQRAESFIPAVLFNPQWTNEWMKLSEMGVIFPIWQVKKLRFGELEFLLSLYWAAEELDLTSVCVYTTAPLRNGGALSPLVLSGLLDFQPCASHLEHLLLFGPTQWTPFHHLTFTSWPLIAILYVTQIQPKIHL